MSVETLLDRAAVAARLGISPRTVTDIVARREIEVVRVSHLLRFTPAAVDAYVARRTRPAVVATAAPPATSTPALRSLPKVRRKRFN